MSGKKNIRSIGWLFFSGAYLATCLAACVTAKKAELKPGQSLDVSVPQEMANEFTVKDYKEEPKPVKEVKPMKTTPKKIKKEQPRAFKVPNRRPKIEPLWVDEKITLDVSWLKTRGGEIMLEVLPFKTLNERKVYHIKGSAKTADFFKMIYRAEDSVESFVDFDGWFPYKFILKGDETKVVRNYLELFDHIQKKQYIHIINHKLKTGEVQEEKGYKDLIPFSQDSISALFYARTLELVPGKTVSFPMTASGRQWDTEIIVLGLEEVDTKIGSIKAIKTQVQTKFNGVVQQQGDSFVWFTNDDRKFPVKFDAKVKIGWVTGIVKKLEQGSPPSGQK